MIGLDLLFCKRSCSCVMDLTGRLLMAIILSCFLSFALAAGELGWIWSISSNGVGVRGVMPSESRKLRESGVSCQSARGSELVRRLPPLLKVMGVGV